MIYERHGSKDSIYITEKGITIDDLGIYRDGSDVVFSFAGSKDTITVNNWFSDEIHEVETIFFADNSMFDLDVYFPELT